MGTSKSTETPDYGASHHYDSDYFRWQNANAAIKARVKINRFAPFIAADDTVLDFGSAGGDMLAGLPGRRKIGVELNDVARQAAIDEHNLEVCKTLDEVQDATADVIVSNHTLEHISSPYEALVQLRRKLKPGGRIVIVVPIDDWRAWKRWDPSDVNRHLFTWSPMNFGHLLDEAGYAPSEIRIIHRSLMPGFATLSRLPRPVFEAAQWGWSRMRHRQEILAVATAR